MPKIQKRVGFLKIFVKRFGKFKNKLYLYNRKRHTIK